MTFKGIVDNIIEVLQALVFLILTLSFVYFIYGIAMYILKYGDDGARTESIKIMTRGLIALFVMFGIWGLTQLVLILIGERIQVPQLSYILDILFLG